MKIVNKLFIALFAIVTVTSFTSCEDDDARFPDLTFGGYPKFVELPEFKAGADPATASFNAVVEDSNNVIASYSVRVRGYFNGATSDTLSFSSSSTLPMDVSFSASEMASVFGVDESVFETGNKFKFFGIAITHDGIVYDGTQTGCDCPQDPLDPTDPDATTGEWNGGQTNDVLLTAASLLQAYTWEVKFVDP